MSTTAQVRDTSPTVTVTITPTNGLCACMRYIQGQIKTVVGLGAVEKIWAPLTCF